MNEFLPQPKCRNKYATQGRLLIALLKKRAMTYRDMLDVGVSTSPWKRVQEELAQHEALIKSRGSDGLIRWKVIAATRWTA